MDAMFKNLNQPYMKWVERNVPNLAKRGRLDVERTIQRAEKSAGFLPSAIRLIGILSAIVGGHAIADGFYSYADQRLKYNIVLFVVIIFIVLISAKIADALVHREIQRIADSME